MRNLIIGSDVPIQIDISQIVVIYSENTIGSIRDSPCRVFYGKIMGIAVSRDLRAHTKSWP